MATKMTSDLEKKFKRAVWLIRNGPPQEGTSTAQKLKFYSLYKQATEGDVTSAQPWAVQVKRGSPAARDPLGLPDLLQSASDHRQKSRSGSNRYGAQAAAT
jgi:hypothetical protein